MTAHAIQSEISPVAPLDPGFELDGHLLSLIAGGEASALAEPEPIGTGRLRAAHYRSGRVPKPASRPSNKPPRPNSGVGVPPSVRNGAARSASFGRMRRRCPTTNAPWRLP